MDAFHPDFEKYPEADGVTVYETITEPGDLIFIPEGWAHQVENLEDSVITSMNFLDNHAIETAERHLPHSFHHAYNPELFAAFFFPLDNPVPVGGTDDDGDGDGVNIEFDDYFAQRFLHLETTVPASVRDWVEQEQGGGATTAHIDTEWDVEGLPALHVAVFYDYFVVLQYLIEIGGADVNAPSRNGMTPLDFAEWNECWEMRELLYHQYGARGRLDPAFLGVG